MSFSDTYFTKYNTLSVHPDFHSFCGRATFYCVYVCVCSPLSLSIGRQWTVRLLPCSVLVNSAAMNTGVVEKRFQVSIYIFFWI